ncbi:MAG: acyltransferase [Planctomycetota bacterium]|nr:MAG: acyltransferase [Planctomycetota bacterium]
MADNFFVKSFIKVLKLKWLCRIIFEIQGWELDPNVPKEAERCVLVAAPHTSNWDYVIGMAAFHILKIPMCFAIKKEWMFFPFNIYLRSQGALAIDRTPKIKGDKRPSMVEAMAKLFEKHERICLMITPEGTRSKRTKWKTGFYHIAMKAEVPIVLGYLDYAKKRCGLGEVLYPSGNYDQDMRKVTAFYKQFTPKYPENFSLDLDYV